VAVIMVLITEQSITKQQNTLKDMTITEEVTKIHSFIKKLESLAMRGFLFFCETFKPKKPSSALRLRVY
jgi:ribosomal protein S12